MSIYFYLFIILFYLLIILFYLLIILAFWAYERIWGLPFQLFEGLFGILHPTPRDFRPVKIFALILIVVAVLSFLTLVFVGLRNSSSFLSIACFLTSLITATAASRIGRYLLRQTKPD